MIELENSKTSRRYRSRSDEFERVPVHVVWEITLSCNLKCAHCGSRAGMPRKNELTTAECIEVINSLARLGTREITIIGGEAYLRRDWLELVKAITDKGIHCGLQTGGRALTEEKIRLAAEAGLKSAGVSIDGLPELHNQLRGVSTSYNHAIAALQNFSKHGLIPSVNTQITSAVIPQLRELMYRLIEAGARLWQVQLTVAMGNAVDNNHLLLQPYQLLDLMPLLAELHQTAKPLGLRLIPGNNVGYFGPYESAWRSITQDASYWTECTAGSTTLGIEADGTIKGCPSLPTKFYSGGNIRDKNLEEIWKNSPQIKQTKQRKHSSLWGFCAGCYYANVCKGGCTWTAHSLLGKPGNNPYCHYRARALSRRGLREAIVKIENAGSQPFDHGKFKIELQSKNGGIVRNSSRSHVLPIASARNRRTRTLEACPSCDEFIFKGELKCPHCLGNVKKQKNQRSKQEKKALSLVHEIEGLLQKIENLNPK